MKSFLITFLSLSIELKILLKLKKLNYYEIIYKFNGKKKYSNNIYINLLITRNVYLFIIKILTNKVLFYLKDLTHQNIKYNNYY